MSYITTCTYLYFSLNTTSPSVSIYMYVLLFFPDDQDKLLRAVMNEARTLTNAERWVSVVHIRIYIVCVYVCNNSFVSSRQMMFKQTDWIMHMYVFPCYVCNDNVYWNFHQILCSELLLYMTVHVYILIYPVRMHKGYKWLVCRLLARK